MRGSFKAKLMSVNYQVPAAALLGIVCGFFPFPSQNSLALVIMGLFTTILKLVSLPIIFLSLLTSLTGVGETRYYRQMSMGVLKWTLLTTILAALVALGLFLLIQPAELGKMQGVEATNIIQSSFWDHILAIIPSNLFQPFLDGNVVGILLLAITLGLALSTVPGREKVHEVLEPILASMMKIVQAIVRVIPLTVWAGIVLSFDELREGDILGQLALYISVVLLANIVQGLVVLPLILKARGFEPLALMRRFMPALTVAFFSKSSVATLPIAIKTAEEELKISSSVARFVFPICTTINMNGCAAFILVTTLFVAISSGAVFSFAQMLIWVIVATIAAVGNAGVPMGCFFLSSALLAAMGVPVGMMGLILPFYGLIDMVETALNVWSDSCVALVVDRQLKVADYLPPSGEDNTW